MDKQVFINWVSKLQSGYQPTAEAKNKFAKLHVVAFVGPTGVGKSTIIEASKLPYVHSDVTRLPRSGEKNGRDYYFRDDYLDILKQIKEGLFAQFVINSNNEFYGTRVEAYPADGVCAIGVIAKAVAELKQLGFGKVTPIYILPPSYVEWMRRIGSARSNDLQFRLEEARESLPIALSDTTYHFVLNDTVENAVADIKTIITGNEVSEHRTRLAQQTAELLIGRLGETEL